jgi:type IV pilus assembly protein PilQ
MKNQKRTKRPAMWMLCALLCSVCAVTFSQLPSLPQLGEPLGLPATEPVSDYVSIKVDGGTLTQVLNAFAIQTGRNVVVGPEVASDGVNIHLNHVRWDDALEVILKPYGFGYRKVGDTIVISKLDKLAALEAVEPLETRVFELRFLDAGDVQDMLAKQLSSRGSMSIMTARGQKGWEFASRSGGGSYSKSGSSGLGKLTRAAGTDTADQVKSKTLVVTDVPNILSRVAAMIQKIDVMPKQVLVEARFLEVNDGLLKDLGLDFSYIKGDYAIGQLFSGVTPANVFNPASGTFWTGLLDESNADNPYALNQGAFAAKTDGSFQGAIRALQKDRDTKVLSAPRILTLNNQEATIIVGQKYPIIESNVSGGSSANNTSTTLDYYENIGIQLNVVPQISGDGYINMIVHPSVSSIVGFESGAVSTGSSTNSTALTQYPVIDTRETETQILLKNKETAVIGGLLQDRKGTVQSKVPFLGDIPFIGRLFRRDTTDNRTIDLLIFLSATIVDENNYDTIIAEEGAATMEGVKPVVAVEEIPAADVVKEPEAAETESMKGEDK